MHSWSVVNGKNRKIECDQNRGHAPLSSCLQLCARDQLTVNQCSESTRKQLASLLVIFTLKFQFGDTVEVLYKLVQKKPQHSSVRLTNVLPS